MNEAIRMQYMEAMGVDMFVPRFLLPAAPVPRECLLPQASQPEVSAPPDMPIQPDAVALPQETLRSLNHSLQGVLADLDLKRGGQRPKAPVEGQSIVAPSAVHDASEPLKVPSARFQLGLWLTDSGIQVVDTQQKDDALPTEALVKNLLFAYGLVGQAWPRAEIQRWPLVGGANSDVDQSWAAAHSMMLDFFAARFAVRPVRGLMVCGEDAYKAIIGPESDFENLCMSCIESPQYSCPVFVLPALRDLLHQPGLKRSLWLFLNQHVKKIMSV